MQSIFFWTQFWVMEEISTGGRGKTLMHPRQRHRQRSAVLYTQALMSNALASRLFDPLVAINVLEVCSKRSSHPETGMDTKQQGWLWTYSLVTGCISKDRVLISAKKGRVTVKLFLSRSFTMSCRWCHAGSPLTLPQSEVSVCSQPGLVLLHEKKWVFIKLFPGTM